MNGKMYLINTRLFQAIESLKFTCIESVFNEAGKIPNRFRIFNQTLDDVKTQL